MNECNEMADYLKSLNTDIKEARNRQYLDDIGGRMLDPVIKNRKIGIVKKVIGKWRLLWKLCPECNSDAPKIYDCDICLHNREAFHNWTSLIKAKWWLRYVKNHTF